MGSVASGKSLRSGLPIFVLAGLAASSAMAQEPTAAEADPVTRALGKVADRTPECRNDNPKEVVVCGRSQQRFRIDPAVLAATRVAEARPPKPALDATQDGPCTGSQCGGGSFIPLIPMALKGLKAAELAANGDDWREAFRTRPDQYKAYQADKKKKASISVGVTGGNR